MSFIILLRIDPLLGNDSVNIFPLKRRRATIRRPVLGTGSVSKPSLQLRGCVFSVFSAVTNLICFVAYLSYVCSDCLLVKCVDEVLFYFTVNATIFFLFVYIIFSTICFDHNGSFSGGWTKGYTRPTMFVCVESIETEAYKISMLNTWGTCNLWYDWRGLYR
jgi:hypothetical protein